VKRAAFALALLLAPGLAAQELGAAYPLDKAAIRLDGQAGGSASYSAMTAPTGCAAGAVAVFLGTPVRLSCLAIGTAGQVLTVNGTATAAEWAAPSALSGLTATRVPFAASATSLEDDASMVYNKTTRTLSLTSTTMATDGTGPILKLTGTLPASPSAAVSAMTVTATSAGSAAQEQRAATFTLGAGFTGNAPTFALVAQNNTSPPGYGNYNAAIFGNSVAAITVGNAMGVYGTASGAETSIGGFFAGSGPWNIGVLGSGTTAAASGSIGVLATLNRNVVSPGVLSIVTALLADNGGVAAPIFLARDNGATVVSIPNGGGIQWVDQGAKPTCDATTRGLVWYDAGAGGVADTVEMCGKAAADTYSWVALATF